MYHTWYCIFIPSWSIIKGANFGCSFEKEPPQIVIRVQGLTNMCNCWPDTLYQYNSFSYHHAWSIETRNIIHNPVISTRFFVGSTIYCELLLQCVDLFSVASQETTKDSMLTVMHTEPHQRHWICVICWDIQPAWTFSLDSNTY